MQELLKKVEKLNLPNEEYAIYGSGPLAIRGIRETNDIDLVVTNELFDELTEKYEKEDSDKLEIENGDVEIFPARNSLLEHPEKAIKNAELIKGFKFLRLDDLIEFKKTKNKDKDWKDIELIKEYLKQNG